MKHNFFTYCLVLIASITFGQYAEDLSKVRPKVEFNEEEATVKKDTVVEISNHDNKEVELLLEEYAEYVDQIKCARGYRIQVYLGRDEAVVNATKAKLKEIEGFEEVDINVEYKVDFRVKVGNYTDRLKAHQDLVKLQEEFPKALLLPESCVPVDKIE